MKKLIELASLALLLTAMTSPAADRAASRPPNIVLIFADDLGYGDLGCFGAKGFTTPHLDRLAREGTRFMSFYVSSPVCSASRAALMTGCYHNRVGIHGALGPQAKIGLHTNEVTIARMLKARGYATAIFGKWHLGRPPQLLPPAHGFDEYLGLPYSNDMWPKHPTANAGTYPLLPLIEGTNVIEEMPDQNKLTTLYTERAVSFIERSKDRPFFLYLAHNLPHVPLHVSDKFRGKSARGLYGDVIEEVDWSVGQVLESLRRHGLEENTWVIFTSDNGPWHSYGGHAGSAGPLREGKGSCYEGGIRVPCVMRWLGKIPAARACNEPLMTIDLLPTIARQTGGALPKHKLDGLDVWPVLSGAAGAKNPHDAYFFYYGANELQALRSGKWKLILPHTARVMNGQPGGTNGLPARYTTFKAGLELYDLEKDLGETNNVAEHNLDVVRRLHRLAEKARDDLGDSLTKRKGKGQREPGRAGDGN